MNKKRRLLFLLLIPLLYNCTDESSISKDSSSDSFVTSEPSFSESSTETSPESSEESSEKVVTPAFEAISLPSEAALYPHATLSSDGIDIPLLNVLVNDSHVFASPQSTRIDSGYGRAYFYEPFTVTLKANYELTAQTKIFPARYQIVATHDLSKNEAYFELYEPGVYVIVTNDNEQEAIHLRLFDKMKALSLETPTISFADGVHDKDNSEYIDANNFITLKDNDHLYLAPGAVVNARIRANNVNNVTISGYGIINGATFDRRNRLVPINFEHSTNITLENFSIIDPAAWVINLYFVDGAYLKDVSVISSRANGDGITLQSCKNIVTTGAFIRAYDDALVVKNYASPYGNSNRETHGSTENIIFDNCFLWVDLAQAMEIGYETVGAEMKNIIFQNITVLYALHKPVISIHNANYSLVHQITFKNITVDNYFTGRGDAGGNYELIDFRATYSPTFSNAPAGGPTEVGSIKDVLVENVLVRRKERNAKITLMGQKDNRYDFLNVISTVQNITLKDITVEKTNITDKYPYLYMNEYVSDVTIIAGQATGHTNYETSVFSDYWQQ